MSDKDKNDEGQFLVLAGKNDDIASCERDPEITLIDREMLEAVVNVINRLPEDERYLFVERVLNDRLFSSFNNELPNRETLERGISTSRVQQRFRNVLNKLRKRLHTRTFWDWWYDRQ